MKNKFFLIIVFLAIAVRFIGLTKLPPVLNRDEAAIGWNAYSILKTGKDEHGQFLPSAFKSIGDYKMPLYIYATTIPIKLFGLNDFSIRFWSALAGVISAIAVYFITFQLFKPASLLTALLFAFNPWSIFYSRIGFEANLSLALFLAGFCLLLKSLQKTKFLYPSLILFLLSFLAYSSSLIFIPLFLIVFIFLNRKKLNQKSKYISLFIFALASVFIFKSLWAISAQKSNITVFSDPAIIDTYNHTRTEIYNKNIFLARTWWNKNVYLARIVVKNYLKTFSPKFLLTQGGNHPWHQVPEMGNFYYLEIIFAVIGLIWLFVSKHKNLKIILFSWLLLAPLASAITIDAPHSTRSLFLLPVILIFSGLGFAVSLKKIKSDKLILFIIAILYILSISSFAYRYIFLYPSQLSKSLPYGLKQAIQLVDEKNIQENIYLYDIQESTYLYPLIYTQFNPIDFQQNAVWTKPDSAGIINAYQFNQFTVVNDSKDIINPQAIILPSSHSYKELQPDFTFANYQVYLPVL